MNLWEKPLALYLFTSSARTRRLFEQYTSSGAVVHDTGLIHVAATGPPFGSVGAGGIGAHHGVYSWRAPPFVSRNDLYTSPARVRRPALPEGLVGTRRVMARSKERHSPTQ
ncbi:hypothetical protein OG906_01645 [Streptomyces sp. NBC_01426]|uniref:hypothetical protein n=1 Tax=unclassified Streptomyces TaxID=2593676 RepID=UPI002E3260CC|nr:hypothetical protein [Streptomyces sp. NBC_01426]